MSHQAYGEDLQYGLHALRGYSVKINVRFGRGQLEPSLVLGRACHRVGVPGAFL